MNGTTKVKDFPRITKINGLVGSHFRKPQIFANQHHFHHYQSNDEGKLLR